MNTSLKIRLLSLALASLAALPAVAADGTPPPAPAATVYGSQLMTPQERRAYRMKMRTAKTPEERARIRAEHHSAMQARAREKGLSLPDMPPAGGAGMGPGGGMGRNAPPAQ
ncbi:MAG: hypothetical protein PHU46_05910 [Rhodocyclaceae bacterium]|nr:hypothetical protein [Rhodocyclaceae bacterium]